MSFLREATSEEEFDVIAAKLIGQIVTTYFMGVYTMCSILQQSETSNQPQLNVHTEIPSVAVTSEDRPLWLDNPMFRAIELGCTVFVVDEGAALYFLDSYIPIHDATMFRLPDKYVVIALQSSESGLLKNIQMHPAVLEIPNLLLVVPDGPDIQLITHRYVGNLPDAVDFLHLDTYFPQNDSFLVNGNLFPNKLDNLMGKVVKVSTFYLLPWAMMRQTDDGIVRYLNQSYTIDGLDGYILIQFCLRHNCTWDLSVDQEKQYGQVFDNHTGNGMIGALVERKVDFAIGAVGGWFQLFQYFSFSTPIQWIGITCLAPRPKLIPSWRIIFLMFSKSVWGLVILTFILYSFVQYLLPLLFDSRSQNNLSWYFINVLGAFLLQPAALRRSRSSEVIAFVSLLIFALIVAYVYMGMTSSIRTTPLFQPPIDTIYDLAVSDLPWNAPHEAWMYALVGTENPYVKKILTTFNVAPIPTLRVIADEGVEALIMAVLNFGHFMVGPWLAPDNVEQYRLMTEFIYFEYDTGYATKTWPLLDRFDHLAMWVRDACLYRYVELVEVYNYMSYRVQLSIDHSRDKQRSELKPLAWGDIQGGLIILLGGYLVALAALTYEKFKSTRERKNLARQTVKKNKDMPLAEQTISQTVWTRANNNKRSEQ